MSTIRELWDAHPDQRPLRLLKTLKDFDNVIHQYHFDAYFIADGCAHGLMDGEVANHWNIDLDLWELRSDAPKLVKWSPAVGICQDGQPYLTTDYYKSIEHAKEACSALTILSLEERLGIELPEKK